MKSMLNEIATKLQNKEITAVDLLNEYLNKIELKNPEIQAFIEINTPSILKKAEESDQRRSNGNLLSKYDGIPIGIKDNIVQKDEKVECASHILKNYVSPYSATVINKLESKGLIPVGRLNMDEFAMGSSTENSSIQITKNPHNLNKSPGGSSGGSAAAIAASFMPVSLGSDTGGSIRQPAAFCGVLGLKPTYGAVSRHGLIAFSSSLDQIGPFASSTDDLEIIFDIISGHDKNDSTSIENYTYKKNELDLSQLKIGIVNNLVNECNEEVKSTFQATIDGLQKHIPSKNFKNIDLKYQKYGIPVYYLTATSEASSNLARFDGIRYGQRIPAKHLDEVYSKSRTKGFGSEVKRRILLGSFALSSGYYDAFYLKAQKVRTLIRKEYEENFKEVDVILLPTAPTPAFSLKEKIMNPIDMYMSDLLTVGASLAGIPALSVPGPSADLPVGIQIQSNFFQESSLFSVSKLIEKEFPIKLIH